MDQEVHTKYPPTINNKSFDLKNCFDVILILYIIYFNSNPSRWEICQSSQKLHPNQWITRYLQVVWRGQDSRKKKKKKKNLQDKDYKRKEKWKKLKIS